MEKSSLLLSSNLRRFRDARGWTQAEFAEKCGLSIKMIQKLEYGTTNPSGETLDVICRTLQVTPAEIYQGVRPSIPDMAGAVEFLSKFQDLPPVLQRLVLSLVYQDDRFARGIKIPQAALDSIQKLFSKIREAN